MQDAGWVFLCASTFPDPLCHDDLWDRAKPQHLDIANRDWNRFCYGLDHFGKHHHSRTCTHFYDFKSWRTRQQCRFDALGWQFELRLAAINTRSQARSLIPQVRLSTQSSLPLERRCFCKPAMLT